MKNLITKISENIYAIQVPLPNNPLRATNSYFIRGRERDLLIDSGFAIPACRIPLSQALTELRSHPERRAVLGTHIHTDHVGLLSEFRGKKQPFYLSKADLDYHKIYIETGKFYDYQKTRFLSEGFPPDEYEEAHLLKQAHHHGGCFFANDLTPLQTNETIDLGGIQIKLLACPGHTPGNSMYYIEKDGILFTGDHILFDISPNITAWPYVNDSLGSYLHSLRQYHELPVKTALPGHRSSGDYHQRAAALIKHHQERLAEAHTIIQNHPGITAYELTGFMKWRIRSAHGWLDFPVQQKYYAVGECLSHCDHLIIESQIYRETINGKILYYPSN